LDSLKTVLKEEQQLEVKSLENSKDEIEKLKEEIKEVKLKDEVKDVEFKEVEVKEVELKKVNEEKESKCKQETFTKNKENEDLVANENLPDPESINQGHLMEENIKKNVDEDIEIPDTMEIIQVTEVLSPKIIDKSVVEDNSPLSPSNIQENVPDELKHKSPSPVSTMTCSIDGNTDTEWNIPVAPAMGTIKINISQKIAPVVKPTIPAEESSLEPQSPQDFTPTFGKIDPDQPPPPGLEMETVVVVPKIQREMKPRLMNNSKKLKEYPTVNKGKEMSGLCSIM